MFDLKDQHMPIIELVSYIITLLGLFAIILLVSLRNTESKVNKSFLLFGLSVFLYSAASFCSELPANLNTALLTTRAALFFANPIAFFFFRFSLSFTDNFKTYKKTTRFSSLLLPVLSVLAFLPTTIVSVERQQFGTTLNEVGLGLWATLLYFVVLFTLSFRMLYLYGKKSDASVQAQIRLMTYGIGLSVLANMITQIVLPTFGINSLGNLIGNPANVVLVGGVGLAIVRHKMFDIKAVIIRSLGFLITSVIIMLGYSVFIFGISKLLFPQLQLTLLQDAYFILIALLLSLTARPLINIIKRLTDKLFFRDEYDPQLLVNEISKILASEINLAALTGKVAELLSKHMRVNIVDIIVLDKQKIYYESAGILKHNREEVADNLQQFVTGVYVKDRLAPGMPEKLVLQTYDLAVLAPLITNNQKIGYLLFSGKSSGVSYNEQDTKLIEIASDQLAIAINNSLSYSLVQQFNATLQKRVEVATEELIAANKKLQEADLVKNDFISMASHQLTTPLAAIDGYLDMATKGYFGSLNDKLKNPLTSALSRARVMKQLVVDLLTVSRMTAGKFVLEMSLSNLDALVETEVNELQIRAKDNSVTLAYHTPVNPLPEVYIDEQKTRQAVTNLIDNAVHYTPGGKVDVYLDQDEENIIFKVVDNGIGVSPEEQPKLFTKFFRASNAQHQRPDGTGIGLYLVKRVIDAQNGKIIFVSIHGKGSTFGFSLPLKPPTSLKTDTHNL